MKPIRRRHPHLACLVLIAGTAAVPGTPARAASPSDQRVPQEMVTVGFTGSADILPNPERGFYHPAPSDLEKLNAAALDTAYREGIRLVYARMDLGPYRARPLPASSLARLEVGFAAARRAGVKLIVRAAYNYPQGETEYRDAKDAPLTVVLNHIAQLKPVLDANADVIAFVQAGFVGAWGEWHASSNGLTEPEARTAIRDALLAAVPAERFVQFRYPPYIIDWLPRVSGCSTSGPPSRRQCAPIAVVQSVRGRP